jgi:hypothetical protein
MCALSCSIRDQVQSSFKTCKYRSVFAQELRALEVITVNFMLNLAILQHLAFGILAQWVTP